MGYRSKVIIGIKSGELSKEFDDILKKHKFPVDKPDGEYLKIHRDPNEKTYYTFDYIKWYDHTDGWCKEIMDWVHEASEDDDNVFCIGIGEDGELHSEVGVYWDYVDVIQDINLID